MELPKGAVKFSQWANWCTTGRSCDRKTKSSSPVWAIYKDPTSKPSQIKQKISNRKTSIKDLLPISTQSISLFLSIFCPVSYFLMCSKLFRLWVFFCKGFPLHNNTYIYICLYIFIQNIQYLTSVADLFHLCAERKRLRGGLPQRVVMIYILIKRG